MKKALICITLCITTLFSLPAMAAETSAKVSFNGVPLNLELPIVSKNDRNYYPFRQFLESIGATVTWNQKTKTATGQLGDDTISFTIGSTKFKANGTEYTMSDAAPFLENDKTYIPIRYACEAFGFTVDWDQTSRTVNIK